MKLSFESLGNDHDIKMKALQLGFEAFDKDMILLSF